MRGLSIYHTIVSNKNKCCRGQVVIVVLWILVILTFLVVSIGFKVSVNLAVLRYRKDMLSATAIAKAAMSRSILEIVSDQTEYDGIKDGWANNEGVFKSYRLKADSVEYATVGYEVADVFGTHVQYGVVDEESKININSAQASLLSKLLQTIAVPQTDADMLAANIVSWRDLNPDDTNQYQVLGYPCKNKEFKSIEEIGLVKGFQTWDQGQLKKLYALITVYGNQTININTASELVLRSLFQSCAPAVGATDGDVNGLVSRIIAFQSSANYPFKQNNADTIIALLLIEPTDKQAQLLTYAASNHLFDIVSSAFLINVEGVSRNTRKHLSCVYLRDTHMIVGYREN